MAGVREADAPPIWDCTSDVFRAHLRQLGADLRHLLLAAVPTDRLLRLRALDPDRYQWVSGSGWPEAVDSIRAKPVEMAVVDPLLGGPARAHGIERIRLLFPSLPLLIYTELAPATAAVLLQLGRAGIRRVVFHRFEDAPGSLRTALQAELEQSASQQVMLALASVLQDLPKEILQSLEIMLHARDEAPTVTALADGAQLTRRTCERWFMKMGLPSPRMVMVLTRLLYAHRLLLDPGYTVEDVALKLGYSKTKTLQMHLREVFGLTAGEIRISLSTEEALMMVANRYFTPMSQVAS
jgi:AraC-like DNA-binding protein